MAVNIRNATQADYDAVYQFLSLLQKRGFDYNKLKPLFCLNIENPNHLYLIAEVDLKPVGYASCHLQTLLHHEGQVAEIQEMFVLPEYRSSGIGKMLMDKIKLISREMGAIQLEVTTRLFREHAIRFYLREDFEDSHKKLVYHF